MARREDDFTASATDLVGESQAVTTMMGASQQLKSQPRNEVNMLLATWLEREAMLATVQTAQLHAQGVPFDASVFAGEDDPGFILAYTFARVIMAGDGLTIVVQ